MARPQKKGLDYFPHDTDAMNDEKLEVMQLLYGNDGYAFYFKMLERIYRSSDLSLDISDAETRLVMIKKCNVDEERFDKMLSTALRQGLFDAAEYEQSGMITSKSVHKRAEVVTAKREKMRERYSTKVSDAETTPETIVSDAETGEETMAETRQRKGKESKGKETKVEERKVEDRKPVGEPKNQYAETVHLSFSEFQNLTQTHGHQKTIRLITELDQYKQKTGKEYTSDYHAITSWVVDRVNEQDSKPRVEVVRPPLGTPKQTKQGMTVHIQETEPVSEEEYAEILRMAEMLDSGKGGT